MERLVIIAIFLCLASCQTINDCPSSVPKNSYLRTFATSCFQFVITHERTHSQAKRDCESHGGFLALVKDQATQDFLYHTLITDFRDFNDMLWIGLNDQDVEDVFKWEDGTPLSYSNWHPSQGPGASSMDHTMNHDENDCVVLDMGYSGKWVEYPCEESTFLFFFTEDELHSYICQYPMTNINVYNTTSAVTEEMTTTTTPMSLNTDTTVIVVSNPCPAFSCDLDCGAGGFQKNETSGCSICSCSV